MGGAHAVLSKISQRGSSEWRLSWNQLVDNECMLGEESIVVDRSHNGVLARSLPSGIH